MLTEKYTNNLVIVINDSTKYAFTFNKYFKHKNEAFNKKRYSETLHGVSRQYCSVNRFNIALY